MDDRSGREVLTADELESALYENKQRDRDARRHASISETSTRLFFYLRTTAVATARFINFSSSPFLPRVYHTPNLGQEDRCLVEAGLPVRNNG